jgi:hypothetical protein
MSNHSENKLEHLTLLRSPEEPTISVVEIERFFDHFRRVGVNDLPAIAAFPHNYDKARSIDEWIFESSLPYVKELGKWACLDISTFGFHRPVFIQKNDASKTDALCIVSSTVLEHAEVAAKLLEFFNLLATHLTKNRERDPSNASMLHAEIIVTRGSHAARLAYEGGSENFPGRMLDTMREVASRDSWGSDPEHIFDAATGAPEEKETFPSKYIGRISSILTSWLRPKISSERITGA